MKRDLATILALLLVVAQGPAAAGARPQQPAPPAARQPSQQATPTPTPTPDAGSEDDVVRITTNLVQFDAVVTDRQGRLVTDLSPEEFEVLVDGRPQQVTNLSFVSPEAGTVTQRAAPSRDKSAPPTPPVPLRAGQVRRTIALIVDDLGTSFESLVTVRRALKRFVDEQMRPGDLVAVMQTGKGLGALQQFTTDKQLLYRAIERVRWNPAGRSGTTAFAAIERDPLRDAGNAAGNTPGRNRDEEEEGPDAEQTLEQFREEIFTVGTLGALNFTIRGMKELPGRKSIVLFGDGLPVFDRSDMTRSSHLRERLRQLADLANRSSVVIYTMDARGLPHLGLTAADSVMPGRDPRTIINAGAGRAASYADSQEGMRFLAEQTGGMFIHDTNDLGGGVQRVLDDQKGYYLIGFRPDESVFERARGGARFNSFEVKVRRPGLRVRTRAGFYGVTESEARPVRRTRTEQIVAALTSPLSSGELPLRMTSLFSSPAEKTFVLDSLIHLDLTQFKFEEEADGWKKAVVDVVALTFGEEGQIVDELNRTETIRLRNEAYTHALANGLVYSVKVPVKKPGAYQLRVAVRDAATEKIGSASQFMEVPDLRKGRLALSGILVMAAQEEPKPGGAAPRAPADSTAADETNPLRSATLRRFRYGSQVDFLYHIYNARADRATGLPQLQTQARLFRDGQAVFTGPVLNFDPAGQPNPARLQAGSRLRLGGALQPGEYVLQVVVTDQLAKGKARTATQWIDFEIVK